MYFFTRILFATSFIIPSIFCAPIPGPNPQLGIGGTPCFGSAATGCTITYRAPEVEPATEIVKKEAEPVPNPQLGIAGTPCFGSATTGCTLTYRESEAEPVAEITEREASPEPVPEPQLGIAGTPCFGSAATGCTLTYRKSEPETEVASRDALAAAQPKPVVEVMEREAAPEAYPQLGIAGTPCFGSAATGCTLTDRKAEEINEAA